ncbi:MAG: cytochrome c maturation protein CcmE [Armatimonadetes bacterium]|nr:cytochrome c maturation protein CcmE [Armatimonadota bacterium]
MNKGLYAVGALVIVAFAAMFVKEVMHTKAQYVTTVVEVQAAGDRPVQFQGKILRTKARYDDKTGEFVFTLKDKAGVYLPVRYKGVKPANYDTAPSAVVRGTYQKNEFIADQVLLKCPSRYAGKKS